MEGQKVWNSIVSTFKTNVSQSAFKTWFSGAYVFDFKKSEDRNLLIIALKNNFLKEEVEKKYFDAIITIAKEKGFSNLDLVFVVCQKQSISKAIDAPLFSGDPMSYIAHKKSDALVTGYTFENLVVGPSNNLAYLAANQVSQNLGNLYNPLFLFGSTGVGKTHLLHSIGNAVSTKNPDLKVMYVTAEKFTNDYVESLRNKTQAQFRQKYRSIDLLLVDDIQFLAGKEGTQDEFFYTFNELVMSGKQIVMASDTHPKELKRIKDRLVSRFLGGMTASVGLPDFEMKVAILKAKCSQKNVAVSDHIYHHIAETCTGGVRELEGILTSVLAQVSLSNGSVNTSELDSFISNGQKTRLVVITPDSIFKAVSEYFHFSKDELRSSSRKAPLSFARHVLIYLLRKEANMPLSQIGDIVGGRDHSTVIHSVEFVEKQVVGDLKRKDEILRITSSLH